METFYFGMKLKRATPKFIEFGEHVRELIAKRTGLISMDFVGLSGAHPTVIYDHDISKCAGNADLAVFLADHDSSGMGFEIGYRCALGLRNMIFAEYPEQVSGVIQGYAERTQSPLHAYLSAAHISELVLQQVEKWS